MRVAESKESTHLEDKWKGSDWCASTWDVFAAISVCSRQAVKTLLVQTNHQIIVKILTNASFLHLTYNNN